MMMRHQICRGMMIGAFALIGVVRPLGAVEIGVERAAPLHLEQEAIGLGQVSVKELVDTGRSWFTAKFTRAEGVGRPGATGAIIPTAADPTGLPVFFRTAGSDSNSCRACHNDPVVGGAGDFNSNAFVSEGFSDADFDSVDPQFSNERGTTALNGSGLVELLAREMTRDLRLQRAEAAAKARRTGQVVQVKLQTKGVGFGTIQVQPDGIIDVSQLEGVDQDLIVRPFSQKGVFTSIRQFTVNALNGHHGMQAVERFGARWTGVDDFDRDGVSDEVWPGDITAMVAFQATLPPPRQVLPIAAARRAAAEAGEKLFTDVGCASCHMLSLPLESAVFSEPNPYNPAGNLRVQDVARPMYFDLASVATASGLKTDAQGRLLVPLFSDLKRHVIADFETPHFANEQLAQRFVNRDEFLTSRLWGVGNTAPYGHRGDLTTLSEVILNHGGEAKAVRQAYETLDDDKRAQVIEFLISLRIVAGAGT